MLPVVKSVTWKVQTNVKGWDFSEKALINLNSRERFNLQGQTAKKTCIKQGKSAKKHLTNL
jgi:hypothetical protein